MVNKDYNLVALRQTIWGARHADKRQHSEHQSALGPWESLPHPRSEAIAFLINAFFSRVKRFGCIHKYRTYSWSVRVWFVKTSIPGHSLHHLLPSYRSSNLRERGHSFHLPDYDTVLFKKSFIVCSLYNLSYLTTNLFLYLLFCVLPVCYDVRLSHLNKHYLLTYLLTYEHIYTSHTSRTYWLTSNSVDLHVHVT